MIITIIIIIIIKIKKNLETLIHAIVEEKDNKISFLDISISRSNNALQTSNLS